MLRVGIDIACGLLYVLVISLSLYQLSRDPDPYKCGALLEGQWLEPIRQWQPPGCLLHKYQSSELSECLQGRLVFIGDSTAREIFWATAEKLDVKRTNQAMYATEKHSDITFSKENIELNFVWDPYLNGSKLDHYVESLSLKPGQGDNADMVLISGGLWHARHLGDQSTKEFESAVENITASIRRSEDNTFPPVNLLASREGALGFLAIAPVRIPQSRSLSPDRAVTLTQERLDPMNGYLQHISTGHGVHVPWSFAKMTRGLAFAFEKDGLHVVFEIATLQADILLNMRCNERLSLKGHYPMDKTCCSAYSYPKWVQQAMILSVGGFTFLTLFTARSGPLWDQSSIYSRLKKISEHRRPVLLLSDNVMGAATALGSTISYSYYADRTSSLNKAHKWYSPTEFRAMCLTILALGVLSIRRSVQPVVMRGQKSTFVKVDQPFLSRDQTDEWKGWMQILILIYHYTGASRILAIYKVIRVLVAAYLFMTGFGHTVYFYRKGDFSLRRCAAVLIRINLLSCILPYVMRTDYLFYYFAPLTSFWYIVVYLTMRIGQKRNHKLVFTVGKITISAMLTTILVRTPALLEIIFMFLEKVARIHWDLNEWRFRLRLDNYIVYVGMLSALAFIRISDGLRDDANADIPKWRWFKRLRILAIVVAITTLPIYWKSVASITEKAEYNSWVPYVSWLPILSFVILRNSTQRLRNFHSSIFAWLGRHSLETFTLQFHIWLAADTKGVLGLGYGRWKDFVLLTIMFLWASYYVAHVTSTITSWLVDPKSYRKDLETEDPSFEMELPRTKDKDKVSSRDQTSSPVTVLVKGWSKFSRFLYENLIARLAMVLMLLWLLNVLY